MNCYGFCSGCVGAQVCLERVRTFLENLVRHHEELARIHGEDNERAYHTTRARLAREALEGK